MILVCGEALYDVFVAGEDAHGLTLDARLGGSAFNVAVGLARLGQRAALVTALGTDVLADKIAAALAAEGVAVDRIVRRDRKTTLALVTLDAEGGARYAFYGENTADRSVTEADLPALADVDAVVFGCFSILTEPTGSSFLELAQRAAGGPVVVLDPNVRATVEPDLSRWRERVAAFAGRADIVKVSSDDLAALYPEAAPDAVAEAWLREGAALVVVTRGGEGARAWLRGAVVDVPATPVSVVDTVGAGDSYLAALLAGLAEGGRLSRAGLAGLTAEAVAALVGFAGAAAAVTCGRRGGDLPKRSELPPPA